MRYYIEAHYPFDGGPILGNCDGQAALGELTYPTRAKRWRRLVKNSDAGVSSSPRVGTYRLVSEHGTIVATVGNWRSKQGRE